MRRAVAAVALLAALAPACAWLEDPFQPFQVDIIYERRGAGVVAVPGDLTVDAPFGFVVLTNETPKLRGFAIDDLAVYETVRPQATVRIRIEEMRDRRRYVFYDHENPGTVRGVIRTRFVAEEER